MSDDERMPLMNVFYGVAAEVDAATIEYELANEWGFILAAGTINFICGILALCSPIAATVVVLAFLAGAMILIGFINICGVCFVENPYRVASLVAGSIILLLGILMETHAVESLLVLTSLVAALFMAEGIFRSVLAIKNRDIPGWTFGLASGCCAIIFSIIIVSAFPSSSEYTLGILLGVNWLVYGSQRIALGLMGRATAKAALQAPSGGDYIRAP